MPHPSSITTLPLQSACGTSSRAWQASRPGCRTRRTTIHRQAREGNGTKHTKPDIPGPTPCPLIGQPGSPTRNPMTLWKPVKPHNTPWNPINEDHGKPVYPSLRTRTQCLKAVCRLSPAPGRQPTCQNEKEAAAVVVVATATVVVVIVVVVTVAAAVAIRILMIILVGEEGRTRRRRRREQRQRQW